ncbi:transposase [Succinivibrio dextrinosolvens]|nr:transposase [Succinivibrio dextrinosolvens]
MDNLNTHNTASLYKAFPPEEARRIARKLEIHYTPKHGSWLDIAEIGINIMTRECLNRRIPDIETLRAELKTWNEAYNSAPTEINWQFSNETSRIKLKSLYPDIDRNQ